MRLLRAHEAGVAEQYLLPLDRSERTPADRRIEVLHVGRLDVPILGLFHDSAGEGVLAGAFDAGGQPQHLGIRDSLSRDYGHDLRLAFGQRARLVDDQRIDALHALERFGVPDEDACVSAPSDAHHDRHRSGEAERAGTRDNQDAHGSDEAESETRLGTVDRPGGERDDGHRDDCRDEPARDVVGETLDRGAGALRLRDHLHDLGQHGVAADLLGPHDEASGPVERAGDHLA